MVVCKEGYILRIASSLYSPSCLQVHHVSETLSELRETYANISLYARSILESCAPLLMQTHGRDFFFLEEKSCHGDRIVEAMSLCLCSPQTLVHSCERGETALSEGNCQSNLPQLYSQYQKRHRLEIRLSYPALPRISVIKMHEYKTLKVSLPSMCLLPSSTKFVFEKQHRAEQPLTLQVPS